MLNTYQKGTRPLHSHLHNFALTSFRKCSWIAVTAVLVFGGRFPQGVSAVGFTHVLTERRVSDEKSQ